MLSSDFQRLTPGQWDRWEDNGFLVIRDVFSSDEVASLKAAADQMERRHHGLAGAANEAFESNNIIEESDEFLNVIDHPVLLGAAMDLMGATIQLLVSSVTYRPTLSAPAIRWHTDDPSPYFFPRTAGRCPVWQLKCAVYLTDVEQEDMGNFVAAPGSHVRGLPEIVPEYAGGLTKGDYRTVTDIARSVPGSLQITARAGDVLMFHPALWHSVARNTSDRVRKNLWFVYGPLWMRLGDRTNSSRELIERCGPVRRQLLGATVGRHRSALAPGDEGAPLIRLWEKRDYNETWRHHLDRLLEEWRSSP